MLSEREPTMGRGDESSKRWGISNFFKVTRGRGRGNDYGERCWGINKLGSPLTLPYIVRLLNLLGAESSQNPILLRRGEINTFLLFLQKINYNYCSFFFGVKYSCYREECG
jgi:hypothetical protein